MVPPPGLEPGRHQARHFKCRASTNFAKGAPRSPWNDRVLMRKGDRFHSISTRSFARTGEPAYTAPSLLQRPAGTRRPRDIPLPLASRRAVLIHSNIISPLHATEHSAANTAGPSESALGDKLPLAASGDGGLIGQYPWRSIPLQVSNDLSPPYFDIFRAQEKSLTTILRTGGDWRWRFCTANGAVLAAGGGYKTEAACVEAVDSLRQSAGSAEIRRRHRISSLPRPIRG